MRRVLVRAGAWWRELPAWSRVGCTLRIAAALRGGSPTPLSLLARPRAPTTPAACRAASERIRHRPQAVILGRDMVVASHCGERREAKDRGAERGGVTIDA